eukprot:2256858-Amphidinium_carterae.1
MGLVLAPPEAALGSSSLTEVFFGSADAEAVEVDDDSDDAGEPMKKKMSSWRMACERAAKSSRVPTATTTSVGMTRRTGRNLTKDV